MGGREKKLSSKNGRQGNVWIVLLQEIQEILYGVFSPVSLFFFDIDHPRLLVIHPPVPYPSLVGVGGGVEFLRIDFEDSSFAHSPQITGAGR
jgi:hypothetical protein